MGLEIAADFARGLGGVGERVFFACGGRCGAHGVVGVEVVGATGGGFGFLVGGVLVGDLELGLGVRAGSVDYWPFGGRWGVVLKVKSQ